VLLLLASGSPLVELLAILFWLAVVGGGLYVVVVWPLGLLLEHLRGLRHEATRERRTAYPPSAGGRVVRCPFCHEDLERGSGLVCAGCRAHHHAACREEHGACASCGATELLGLGGRARTHPLGQRAPEASA